MYEIEVRVHEGKTPLRLVFSSKDVAETWAGRRLSLSNDGSAALLSEDRQANTKKDVGYYY